MSYNELSLVGMSMSARKRAARSFYVEQVFRDTATKTTEADKGTRWFHLWCRGSGEIVSKDFMYLDLRRIAYRVGEHLRPDGVGGVAPARKSRRRHFAI
jgi:hypothetical protein